MFKKYDLNLKLCENLRLNNKPVRIGNVLLFALRLALEERANVVAPWFYVTFYLY